jgi:hypothetical protein
MENTSIDTPIFKPEQYTDCTDRMIAEMHKTVLELRQEVHELRLAVVEQSRIQQRLLEDDGR